MKSIDDIKAITIDDKTYEAARAGMRPTEMVIERLFMALYNSSTIMLTEIDTERLSPSERTALSALLQKAQIGSRPFDLATLTEG